MMKKLKIFFKTLLGKSKDKNQDYSVYCSNDYQQVMIAIADGVSSHHKSQLASQITCQILKDNFQKNNFQDWTAEAIYDWVKKVITTQVEKKLKNISTKIATTLTMVLLLENRFYLFHVGDTRFFQMQKDKDKLLQLTQDHNFNSALNDTFGWLKGKQYLKNAISNYGNCYIDFSHFTVQKGYWLLTTDGLHDFLEHDFVYQILKDENMTEETKIEILFNRALTSGSLDDITCLLVKIE